MANNLTPADQQLINQFKKNKKKQVLQKIAKGYPPQYAIGNVNFMSTKIIVNRRVLIPRFETEKLVLNIIKHFANHKSPIKVIDIGTGSGCIAVALALNLDAKVEALDISWLALSVARRNAKLNKVKVKFKRCNILRTKAISKYDLIVSNPPYIEQNEEVDPMVKYEPKKALYAKNDALKFYKKIMQLAQGKVKKNGLIAFEISSTKGQQLKALAQEYFPQQKVVIAKDLADKDRYLFISDFK